MKYKYKYNLWKNIRGQWRLLYSLSTNKLPICGNELILPQGVSPC